MTKTSTASLRRGAVAAAQSRFRQSGARRIRNGQPVMGMSGMTRAQQAALGGFAMFPGNARASTRRAAGL